MKIKPLSSDEKDFGKEHGYIAADYIFHCPGCRCDHGLWTTNRNYNQAIWTFNGSLDRPTVSPSILVTWHHGDTAKKEICHSFINDGKIQFLTDCTHALAGQTVELPDYEI